MAFCDGKLYGALRSDQDYVIDYVNVNDTTVQYMYPLQQNPSSTKSFQDDLPVIYDQSGSSGPAGDPESTMDFRSRRGISAYGKCLQEIQSFKKQWAQEIEKGRGRLYILGKL